MLRSMSSAISGLKNHQIYMDVVGQNIANVNTVGYKSSRVNFKEALAQTYKVGSAPVIGGVGGTNPSQVGLGVNLGGIDTIMTQGPMTSTGKTTDLAIQGEGMFMLGTSFTGTAGAADQNWTPAYFTRDGAFAKDEQGYLVDPVSGEYVLGAKLGTFTTQAQVAALASGAGPYTDTAGNAVDVNGFRLDASGNLMLDRIKIDPSWGWANFSISSTGAVTGVKSDGTTDVDPMRRPQVALGTFNNPEGLVRAGGNLYREGLNSGTATRSVPGDTTTGAGSLMSGTLEASNVDLAEQFSRMIMAERGFQANSRIITASDEMLQDLVNMKR